MLTARRTPAASYITMAARTTAIAKDAEPNPDTRPFGAVHCNIAPVSYLPRNIAMRVQAASAHLAKHLPQSPTVHRHLQKLLIPYFTIHATIRGCRTPIFAVVPQYFSISGCTDLYGNTAICHLDCQRIARMRLLYTGDNS